MQRDPVHIDELAHDKRCQHAAEYRDAIIDREKERVFAEMLACEPEMISEIINSAFIDLGLLARCAIKSGGTFKDRAELMAQLGDLGRDIAERRADK